MAVKFRTGRLLVGLLVLVGFSISVSADRLSLPAGGYGRVLGLQEYPLTSFTLSGWVNVTQFPEGIAPFLTYLSKDVDFQLSFFLRPDGVGILWGGPTPTTEGNLVADIMQRRPRAYTPKEGRSKREVDYSGGLGDIENILTRRSGFTDNSWAPMNFVDVAQMGVDDLMTSGSENSNLHAEERSPHANTYSQWTNVPYELHMQESETDRDSGPHQTIVPAPRNPKIEPRIITQPSGGDDFVFFNWNVPGGNPGGNPENQIPLGSNSWSPVWESVKENQETNAVQQSDRITFEEPQRKTFKAVFASLPEAKNEISHKVAENTWVTPSQNHGVDLTNKWDPLGLNADVYEHRPVETKLLPTKFLRPVWPNVQPPPPPFTQNNSPIRGDVTAPPVPKTTIASTTPTTTTSSTTAQPSTTTKPPHRIVNPAVYRYTKKSKHAQSPTVPTGAREVPQPPKLAVPSKLPQPSKPFQSKPQFPYKSPPSKLPQPNKHLQPKLPLPSNFALPAELALPTKRTKARVPLWKLIKKPLDGAQKPVVSTTTKRTVAKTVPKKDYTITNPAVLTTQKPLSKATRNSYPEPTLPPLKPLDNEEILQMLGSQKRNVFLRSRPLQSLSIARRTTPPVRTTTQASPLTTSRRIPFRPTPITHKVPNYHSSLGEKSHFFLPKEPDQGSDKTTEHSLYSQPKEANRFYDKRIESKQTIGKPHHNKYSFTKKNAFEKAMQDPQLVKEGNRAVVYAVPITNEKEFYEMYKKYQKESKSAMNIHELYNEMRTSGTKLRSSGTEPKEEEEVNHNRIKAPDLSHYNSKFNDKRIHNRVTTPTTTFKPTTTFRPTTTESATETVPKPVTESEFKPMTTESVFKTKPTIVVQGEEGENKVPTLADTKNIDIDYVEPEVEITEGETYPVYEEDGFNDYYYDYYEAGLADNEGESTSYYDTKDITGDYSTDYFLPGTQERPQPSEQLSDLYILNPINAAETSQAIPSHYQEPQRLFHEQQPPQYQKPPKRYDYKGPTIKTQQIYPSAPNQNSFQVYGLDPFDTVSPGLMPEPIHHAANQEAKNRMDMDVQESQRIDEPTLIVPPNLISSALPPPGNTIPVPGMTQTQNTNGLTSEKVPLDIHFEKLDYEFTENAWYHLTFTWDASTKRATVYVNGEVLGTIENVLEKERHLEAEGLLLLGKTLLPDLSDFDESSQFVGEMSDVNMWATQLPPQTVDAVFQCKYTPLSSQPLDWDSTELKLYDSASMTSSPPLCGLVT